MDDEGPRSLIRVHVGGSRAWFGLQSCLAGGRHNPDRDYVVRSEGCLNGIALYLSQASFHSVPRSPTIHIWRD